MNLRWTHALIALLLVAAGCGGGTDRTKAQVRLVNATRDYAQLELRVDDQTRQSGVAYGGSASYVDTDPGKASSINSAGSATALVSFTPATSKDKSYTLLAYGSAGTLKQLLLDDNSGDPDNNRSLLRIVNAAPDAGALDVYLTADDTLAVPVLSNAAYGVASAWLTVTSGTWRLRVTGNGDSTDLRLDIPALVLASKQIVTLVLAPSRGGVLVNGLALTQKGNIGALDQTQARVRVVGGLADNASVVATVAGTPLPTVAGSVSAYALRPAGDAAGSVQIGSASQSAPAKTLLAGADYTLVVYGTSSAATASWVDDDNRLPTLATNARVRLVNGLSSITAPVTLTANNSPVGSSVAQGRASDYSALAATTTGSVSVTASGLVNPVYEATNTLTFTAGNVYSVFVIGNSRGFLFKDR